MSEREHAGDPVNAAFDQGCRRRRPRSSTAAASSVAPNRNITAKESGAAGDITIGAGQSAGRNAPRRILGHHPPRDKEHQLASRKCRRESTPATTLLVVLT